MARTGGILTFIMIGAVVLAVLLSMAAQAAPVLGIIAMVLNIAAFVLWFVVMIALKVTLDQSGYHRAGGLIWFILILTVLTIVLSIVAAVVGGTQIDQARGNNPDPALILRALGVWAVVIGAIALCLQVCFLLLGLRLNEFSTIGGGIWKGAGIVLVIGTCFGLAMLVLYIVMLLTQVWGIAILAGILGFVAALLWAAFWIILGIAFMAEAGRMAASHGRIEGAAVRR